MLKSDREANVEEQECFPVSLTLIEVEFMIIQMEASISACKKAGIHDLENHPHYQGLCRILSKFRCSTFTVI